jgi:hypothetical protein
VSRDKIVPFNFMSLFHGQEMTRTDSESHDVTRYMVSNYVDFYADLSKDLFWHQKKDPLVDLLLYWIV